MDIVELCLMTHVLAAQRAFYVETFDLTLLADDQESFAVQAGHTRLVFEQASPAASSPSYHFAFNIPENMLEQAKRWLSRRTQLLPIDDTDEVYFEEWNAHACYFHDPAGNIVEFIARHDLRNPAPGPFGPGDILGVSEIGLPVPDVGVTVRALKVEVGLLPWRPPSETFAALGDEDGLVIVVKQGRPWLPTGEPAAAHPVGVTFQGTTDATYTVPDLLYHIAILGATADRESEPGKS